MRGMPLPFEFQGKGVVDFSSDSSQLHHHLLLQQKWKKLEDGFCGYVGVTEHTSVLDSRRSPSPPTSSSTLSSSLGSGGGGGGSSTALETGSSGAAAAATAPEKCGIGGMEDWENVLSDFAVSPSRDQSMLPYLMGDIDDPTSMGLSKLLQSTAGVPPEFEFSGGFGALCQGSELGSMGGNGNFLAAINHHPSLHESTSGFSAINNGGIFSPLSNNLLPISVSQGMLQQQIHHHHQQQQQQQPIDGLDEKPQIFNPQVLINQHQAQPTQNPAMFLPLSFTQQEQQHLFMPPNPKRLNTGGIMEPNNNNQIPKVPFMDSGQELYSRRQSSQLQQQQQQQQQQHHNHHQQGFPQHHHQLQLLPNHLHHQQQQRPTTMATPPPLQPGSKPKMAIGSGGGGGGEEMVLHQQATIEQIFKAVELVEMGNSVLAQGILARLNHQLSPIGKPFHRVAFYFKESLQLLLHNTTTTTTTTTNNNNNHNTLPPTTTTSAAASSNCSPFSLIFKIGAYKSFSEISPLVQFANFTCNQAILEALEGFDRIHIIDFDIGYGGQWASLMQELALRNGGPPSLKITAFASPSTHDELELGLTRENLNHFAGEINMPFELEIVNLESLNSTPLHVSNSEAIAVNLPIGAFSNYPLSLPLVLRFVKQLLPKIVVSLDRGCDRTDLPFPHHTIHALQSYTSLLESLDAVNVNLDALQKIERFLIHPGIERIVLGRHRFPEKTPPWKSLFLSSGFSPLTFSNFTESQADCLVQRTPVRGFHVEKRQSSLVLCWQQKDLISASAWRCC